MVVADDTGDSSIRGVHRVLHEINDHAGEVVRQFEKLWARTVDAISEAKQQGGMA
jgi:sugar (pentulose or hexulose) kinase